MVKFMVATIGLMFGQVPLEVQVSAEDEQGMTAAEMQDAVDHLIGQGFTPRIYGRGDSGGKMDKTGTVTGVKPIPDTKMFEVTGLLDSGAGEFKWKEFTATTFRKGDRFKVGKNDRGFYGGIMIIDEGEQQELPM